ncbi:MAG: hypothetical protein ABUS54_14975 [Actinomycetota bacterium]
MVAAHAAKPPCALVTAADVAAVAKAKPGKPQAQTLGLFKSCTYRAGAFTVTVQSRQVDHGTFVKSAKANPGPVKQVNANEFSVGGGTVLLVWKHGTSVTVLVLGAAQPLAAEQALANRALARL